MREQGHDGDAETESELKRRRRRVDLAMGIALLAIGLVGASLAQSISLSPNDRVEFGQGAVTVKACDSFITISLEPSPATYSGTRANGQPYSNMSRVRSIKLTGLNTKSCAGKKLKIQIFNSETTTAMSLYTDASNLTVNRAYFAITSNNTIPREDALTLINGKGQDIGYFDSYQYLNYNSNSAEYTVIFTYPLALMADVTRVNLETTNA